MPRPLCFWVGRGPPFSTHKQDQQHAFCLLPPPPPPYLPACPPLFGKHDQQHTHCVPAPCCACRVGLAPPSIEVRFEDLCVETSASVGDKQIPTVMRTIKSSLKVGGWAGGVVRWSGGQVGLQGLIVVGGVWGGWAGGQWTVRACALGLEAARQPTAQPPHPHAAASPLPPLNCRAWWAAAAAARCASSRVPPGCCAPGASRWCWPPPAAARPRCSRRWRVGCGGRQRTWQ